MKKKIGLYFQLEAKDNKESLSIVKQALNRLNQLEDEGVDVQYFELRVNKFNGLSDTNVVSMKLDGNGRTFIESESGYRWDDAFINAFDRIHDHTRTGFGRPASAIQYV